jgi:hypothetical protein
MPTIAQLPLATDVENTDELPVSQGGVSRSVTIGTLLQNTQDALTLATGSLLGRVSLGPGGPESIALGTGLQIQDDVLLVDHSAYPQTDELDTDSTMLLNDTSGDPQLMPISLLRGLYTAGQNITIDADGTIHSTPSAATGDSIGAVAIGNALVINASGQLSVNVGTVSGTVAAGDDSRIVGAEQIANKDVPNGYAGLDSSGMVPANLLPAGGDSAVTSVAGRTGAVVLTTADIGGLGSIATQSAAAVAITGGTIAGATTSTAVATANLSGAVPRTLAAHFSDVLNINDFALARDGVTDDSEKFVAACQTAITQHLKVYIPSGGPILLTDAAQQNLTNLCIYGDGIRDYDSSEGYGHQGSTFWFTGLTKTPFLIGPNVQFQGLIFFWPNQTEVATTSNGNLPIAYPPLFAQQSPAQNIVYFNFVDCQVTNCYDFLYAVGTVAVVGSCIIERCTIYAIHNCFTLQNVPEVIFIANCLFTFGVYGSVVSVGPTYNLRSFTNTQGTWMKVVGDGTATSVATTSVGGIMSSNNYIYGSLRGIWLAAGTLDISAFINTSFDTVPIMLQGDTGCAMFSTRFNGGTWYPIYLTQAGNPDTTAIVINNPAPAGVGMNFSFSNITVPFVNGSLVSITGSNISNISFNDIRCNALGHTTGGAGPYYGFQFNAPNANIRLQACDIMASDAAVANTGVQITACNAITVSSCVFRNMTAPVDVETVACNVTLIGNTSQTTQGASPITGIGTTNVHDLFNNWDKANFVYNGFAPNNFRAAATIGINPVACSASAGYVGVQPSATGTGGGTRFGVTAVGTGVVSLLTNAFSEEQLRVNRQIAAVNYLSTRGSVSGSPALVTAGGADSNGSVQLCGLTVGPTLLGSAGASGSPVIRIGAMADQSYVASAPSNAFTISLPSNCSTLLLRPSGALSTGTIILPSAIADGEIIEIWTSKTITALTVSGASGTTVNNGVGFELAANASVGFFWNAANATWFQELGGGTGNGSIASQNANDVTITGGSITGLSQFAVGTDSSVSASVVLDTAPGYARLVVYESASVPRWVEGVQGTPEDTFTTPAVTNVPAGGNNIPIDNSSGSVTIGMLVSAPGIMSGTTVNSLNGTTGVHLSQPTTAEITAGTAIFFYSNQGADFAILPYDDTGAPMAPTLGQPFLITRATGQVTITTLAVVSKATAPTPPSGDSSVQVATTAFVTNAINTFGVPATKIGAANGVAALDGTGRVPTSQLPASIQGALDYQGTWNASTNAPALASGIGTKGFYYTVAIAGATILDGIGQWNAGDHAAFNGAAWEKLDGLASEVISVAGRTGTVALSTTDIAGLGSIATQASSAVAITGGTITGVTALALGASNGGAIITTVNAAAGSPRQFVYQTGGISRWNLITQADAESPPITLVTTASSTGSTTLTFAAVPGVTVGMSVGAAGVVAGTLVTAVGVTTITISIAATVASGASISFYANVGSSFALRAYDDGGNLLNTALSVTRSTGVLTILGTVATTGYAPIAIQGGSATLGNGRGLGAFDGQQYRTAATQVASGQYAAAFGSGNIASGTGSFAAGATNTASNTGGTAFGNNNLVSATGGFAAGSGNTISGSYSHCIGYYGKDWGRWSGSVLAGGYNTAAGDAQRYETVLRATTTGGAVRLTADGATAGTANVVNLQNNQVAKLNIELIGFNAAAAAAASWFLRDVLLVRGASASTTALSSAALSVGGAVGAVSGWTAPTIGADTTNGGLIITSGYAASTTIKWVARVVSVEVM